jgi:tRNA U34 2-thiouridine synthase MnmA/TrmU
MNIASGKYLQVIESRAKKRKTRSADRAKIDGYMLCALTAATNEAMTYFKNKHCDGNGRMI